jgi:hypothetical protein
MTTVLVLAVCASGSLGPNGAPPEYLLVGNGGAAPTGVTPGPGSPGPGVVLAATRSQFSIAGSVTGLYPGVTLPLVLVVTNSKPFTISVQTISTTVGSPSIACPGINLHVTSFSGQLPVAPGSTTTTVVEVSMDPSAPDACQGALFPLSYLGFASAS